MLDTFLKTLTGRDLHTFHCVNRYWDRTINKSRQVKTFKEKPLYYAEPHFQNKFRDVFVSVKGVNKFIRIDLDKYQKLPDIISRCSELGITPNYLMPTTKGFHLFFIFDSVPHTALFGQAKTKLNTLLGGDESALESASIRLPNTFSYSNRWNPMYCKLEMIASELIRFDAFAKKIGCQTSEEFRDLLFGRTSLWTESKDPGSIPLPTRPYKQEVTESIPSGPETSAYHIDSPSQPGRFKEIGKVLREARGSRSDLESYLGVRGKSFRCPFHKDRRASATISQKGSDFLFRCFKCEVNMDLVGCVEHKEGLSGVRLINKVMKLMDREDLVIESQSKGVNLGYLDVNLNFLRLLCNYAIEPWVERFLSRFVELSKSKIKNQDCKFPASTSEIKKTIGGGRSAITKLYLMRLAGLLQIAEIPEAMKESQDKYKARTGRKNDTSWHFIPAYSTETIEHAVKVLKKCSEFGLNTMHCTKAQVKAVFGEDAINKVYHGQSTILPWYLKSNEQILEEEFGPEASDDEIETQYQMYLEVQLSGSQIQNPTDADALKTVSDEFKDVDQDTG